MNQVSLEGLTKIYFLFIISLIPTELMFLIFVFHSENSAFYYINEERRFSTHNIQWELKIIYPESVNALVVPK